MIRCLVLLFAFGFLLSCSDQTEQEINCSTLSIALKSKTNPTQCLPPDGDISVFAFGGNPPYSFRINNGGVQSDSLFANLQGGNYLVEVIDAAQCTSTLEVSLSSVNSDLNVSFEMIPNTDCLIGNGSVKFMPNGGTPPYQLKFNNKIVAGMEVSTLNNGLYQAVISDANLCEFVIAVSIPQGVTSTSWSVDIKPIIDTRCAKPICHVSGTGRSDFSKLENVQQLATQIKTRTQNGSMPFDEPMPNSQIQLIACWVNDGARNN